MHLIFHCMTMFYEFILKKLQQKCKTNKVKEMLMYSGKRNTYLVFLEGGKESCTLHMVSLCNHRELTVAEKKRAINF